MTREDDLERLLDEAREASPAQRLPRYRDPIVDFGAAAVEPLATWIDEPAFAAFAIRTLGRIAASHPDAREAVVAALTTADRTGMVEHIARDLDAALDQLGMATTRRAASARGASSAIASAPRGHRTPDAHSRDVTSGPPPPAQGPCAVSNRDGSVCNNPGRWPVSQGWSCTSHILALTRRGEL